MRIMEFLLGWLCYDKMASTGCLLLSDGGPNPYACTPGRGSMKITNPYKFYSSSLPIEVTL